MISRSTILIDVDHTISNAFWRDAMIGGPWDEYHAASFDDKPIEDIVRLLTALSLDGNEIVGITARPEKWRQLTMSWLLRNNVPMDELLMRPDDAFRPSAEIKMELAKARFKSLKDQVAFIMDDRDDVIAAFRAEGITCLQVFARKDTPECL